MDVPNGRAITQQVVVWLPVFGGRGQLGSSSATLYTAPTSTTPTGTLPTLLTSVVLCNTDTVDHDVTLYLVESGGSAAANRMLLSAATIPTGKTWVLDFGDEGGIALEGAETLAGFADLASKVTYRVSVKQMSLLA